MKTVVVALGGNAFSAKGKISLKSELSFAEKALESVVGLLRKGFAVAVTHGNGLQVGNILLRSEAAKKIAYPVSLDVAVAQSQGELGFIIASALQNILRRHGVKREIAVVLTSVLVNQNDPAFSHPSKAIGPFYSRAGAMELKRKGIPVVFEIGRGYRRVVPSPAPEKIMELNTINALLEKGFIVVCCGGGGIPIARQGREFRGVECVVDKDHASALLGCSINAELLLLLTGADCVYLGFGARKQKPIRKMTVAVAKGLLKENQFEPGTMKPKIEAAVEFVESTGRKAIITSPGKAIPALNGKHGTLVSKN